MPNTRLPKRRLMLLMLTLLLAACTHKPSVWQPEPAAAPNIPVLPKEARQVDNLSWCLPSCSAGLTKERESWQLRMTELESQE